MWSLIAAFAAGVVVTLLVLGILLAAVAAANTPLPTSWRDNQ